jgi:glycosyltransferase involved in cell wall biosynthesis
VRLVYDLRYATDHFPGIGTHAWALASALLRRERFESITLLWDPRARNTRFNLDPLRHHPRTRWLQIDVPAMAVGTAHGTGRVLAELPADVFLSPFWLHPRAARMPCVLTLHDVLPLALPQLVSLPRRLAYTWQLRHTARAAAVLTSSRFSRDEILRLTGIPGARLHVLPLGIAEPDSTPHPPGRAPGTPYALVVGTDRAHKGLETLLEVWRGFADSAPLALVWAGAGDPANLSRATAAHVHALGHVFPGELEWLYRNATLVVVPSRYEGFGLPLLEAVARGAPVLASDIPALRETGEGVVRFIPAGVASAWATAIRELAADTRAREAMSAAGLLRAREYRYELYAERVEALLVELARATDGAAA